MSGDSKKHIAIAIPAYSWAVSTYTMRSLLIDCKMLWERGDKITFIDECGSTDLTVAKAMMIAKFLDSDADCLMHVDSDVAWEAGAMVKLIDAPVPFVGGVYPKRRDPLQWPVGYVEGRDELWADPEHGLLEVAFVPGGFMRFTRECLEDMESAYSDLAYGTSRYPDGKLPGFFEHMYLPDGTRIRDDIAFCHRWRAIGGKVWTDPDIHFAHVGPKAFEGSLGNWLKSR